MTEQNEEIVRRILDGWAEGDFRSGVADFDPDVVLAIPPELIEAGEFAGLEGVREASKSFMSQYEQVTISGEDLQAAGDKVMVRVTQVGRGKGSGIDLRFDYFIVFTLRDGKVTRVDSIVERDDAVEAAGMSV